MSFESDLKKKREYYKEKNNILTYINEQRVANSADITNV